MRVMVLDTETPGFKKPLEPVELAYILLEGPTPSTSKQLKAYDQRFKPKGPMEWGAVATHNIIPADLAGCPAWDPNLIKQDVYSCEYLVGHNVDYDWEVIGSPGVKRIDVLALSRFYYPDLDSHRQSAMMYYLFGASEETRTRLKAAHSAVWDVNNCLALLNEIVNSSVGHPGEAIHNWNEIYAVSEQGRVPYRMTFGKYGPKDGKPGKRIRDLKVEDMGYVSWLRKNCSDDKYLMKALDNPR